MDVFTEKATLFVIINYGENEELLINPNCRQVIFMEYLRKKCQYDSKAFIDLLDETGSLANVHQVAPQDNLAANFVDRLIYIPSMLEKSGDDKAPLKRIKPQLTDWEKKFPQLERKIKILTGEMKRKKSPSKGAGLLDRKASSKDMGRPSSIAGRPSSIASHSGRPSMTNAGKAPNGRKSMAGGKLDTIKAGKAGKKGKKK